MTKYRIDELTAQQEDLLLKLRGIPNAVSLDMVFTLDDKETEMIMTIDKLIELENVGLVSFERQMEDDRKNRVTCCIKRGNWLTEYERIIYR